MLIYLSTRFLAASKMRVGGIDLDVQFCHRLCIGLSLATIAIWFCLRYVHFVITPSNLNAQSSSAKLLVMQPFFMGSEAPVKMSKVQGRFLQI